MLSSLFLLAGLVGIVVGLALLFLPTIVAKCRNHPNTLAIFLVNLFLGWTFIGWVVSLVWACTTPAAPVIYAPVYPVLVQPPHLDSPSGHPQAAFPPQTAQIIPPAAPFPGTR